MQEAGARARRVWGFWATTGLGLVVGFTKTVAEAGGAMLFAIVAVASAPDLDVAYRWALGLATNGLLLSLATCASAAVGVSTILGVVLLRRGAPIDEYLALRPVRWRVLALALACCLGLLFLSDGLTFFLGRPVVNEFMARITTTSSQPALFAVALFAAAPLFEEVLFRGFLFQGYRRSWLGPIGAIVLTALLWAGIHLQYDLYDRAMIFVSGVLLGVVRLKTGSMLPCLAMHGLWNAVATLEAVIYVNGLAPWLGTR